MAFFETVLISTRYIFKAASAFIETKPRASELENFLNQSFVESISIVLKKFGISGFGSIIDLVSLEICLRFEKSQ